MKIKKILSLLLAVITLLSVISFNNTVYAGQSITYYKGLDITNPLYIPSNVPATSTSGNHPFNDKYWVDPNYHVIVYGTTSEVGSINDGPTYNSALGTWEYRYLGFDQAGNPFSNTRYPDDADLGPNASKPYEPHPWLKGLCIATPYSKDNACAADINRIWENPKYGFPQGYTFYAYGNVQSYPTLLAPGSFRMWHLYNGSYWYQTFEIPKKTTKLDTPYNITTQILSSDFTIAENETTVDVSVKVTFKLNDESYYADPIKKVLYYTRDDIKKWELKVEYKGTETYVALNPDGTNSATNTFNIKLSRSQLVDMENVVFNGVGRVTFHNDKYYKDSDPKPAQFRVIPNVQPLPPDLTITAPAKVNVKEAYTVKVNPVVPQGESIKTVVLEASVNGGAYQPITLSSNQASQIYNSTGTINYRATVTLNNNKTATATATTNVVDERSSDATAKIEQLSTAYEGYWVNVKNRNTFTFDGSTYNALDASNQGIGSSDFEILDNSQYPLTGSLYQTRNYNSNVSFDIRYMQPGVYKNTIYAIPINGDAVTDTKSIQVLRCPAIIASVDGTKKSNRKMTLNFSSTVNNPDYPLVSSKTSVVIEDTVTGEKVTCTNSSHPDSTNIKTNALSGNKMDFLIKTSVDKIYKATVYVEDTRGNSDMQSITFTVAQDKAPIAKISTKAQELRKPSLSNKAEIFLQDDSYSEDGDYVTRTWEVAIDTDNDGLFTDETYKAVNLLDGYQDISGDSSQKKVRFLKTGVGKINTRVKSKEVFGQTTIDAFVTATDRKEATLTSAVDVINVAPVVDFKIFSNVSTNINIIMGKVSSTLQTSVQNLIATMQSQLLGSKITPTINLIPLSRDRTKEVWSQPEGNAQKNGYIPFDGPLNLTQKWQINLQDVVHNDEHIKDSSCFIMPDGNLLVSGSYYYSDLVLNKTRYYYFIKVITPEGAIIKDTSVETTDYGVSIQTPIIFIMNNGNILGTVVAGNGKTKYVLYDSNFNIIRDVPDGIINNNSFVTQNNIIYTHYTEWFYPYQGSNTINYRHYVRAYDSNLNLIFQRQLIAGTTTSTYYPYSTKIITDQAGNCYVPLYRFLIKIDSNGNIVWARDFGDEITDFTYDTLTDKIYVLYKNEWYDPDRQYINKINSVTGDYDGSSYYSVDEHGTFRNIHVGKDYVYINTSDYRDYVLKFDKNYLSYQGYFNTVLYPFQAITTKDGAVLIVDRALAGCTFLFSGNGSGGRMGNGGYEEPYCTSSGVFGSNNTVYLVGAYYSSSGYGNWPIDNVTGPMFVKAIGTGGTEQNTDNTLRKINENIPVGGGKDFVISITEDPYQDNTDANITNTANLLKNKNDRFLMIGNSSSKPDGQKILNKGVTGSLFDINSNMATPLTSISNYIKSILAPDATNKVYEYSFNKNEIVNYDTFYSDYELDPSKSSQWRYYHTPKTDGIIANNGVWLSSPITQFTKNGTYRVQHQQTDSTGVTAYDKNSNIIELVIHVEDGITPPAPLSYKPEANIELEGSTKQNRKLTLKLNYSNNNALPLNTSTISWTLTPVSGMAAADIKKSSSTTQNIDTLYKKSGRVRATCTYKDTQGNQGTATTEFDIAADLAPSGTLRVTPIAYRNGSGIASINVKADFESPDDYINTLKYYITYDADNNGSFTNDTKTYLPQFDNLREFNVDVNTGVGNYMIQADATEGFREPTIPAYIVSIDYLQVSLQGTSTVDNISPTYDVKPEKDVYLVGEEIRFKSFDGSFLNGDSSKGFFDTENDPMTGFRVKYTQNKTIMPIQDKTSAYAANIDYMSQVVDWKDANIWSITPHSGGSIVWDSTKQAWKVTGDVYMYLKPEYAVQIDPQSSYYMEMKVMRENNQSKSIYWGGDRLDDSKAHLPGFGGTYDYSAASAAYPAVGTWTTYSKTKSGTAASPDGWGADGCRYFRIGGLINYNGSSTQVTYIKDIKFITPAATTELANSLDRAGEYSIDINAYDDPKDGDVRFAGYNKPSNTCSNTIIVHRRPVAALSFAASHSTAPVFDFGSNMYLDGTQLKITDASSDPDGFNVTSSISYKADSGNYVQLNSGDTINLYYGSVFTIKVTTTDNWGADDTAIYLISVVPDLNMVPEVIPHTIKVGNNGTLKLTTNQYATSARAVVFGINYNLNLVSSTATEKVWQNTFNVPLNTPVAQYPAQFYATAEGMAEQRKDTHFHTTINSPPTIDIICITPSVVYEGDDVSVTFQPADPDLDTLTGLIELYDNGNNRLYTHTITINPNGSTYNLVTQVIANDIALGNNYRVEVTVTDPYDEFQKDTYTFSVLPLSITGFVNHTTLWNEHRQDYNISKTGNPEDPRTYDVFFPGERFILDANTSAIDSSRPDLYADSVTCTLLSYGYSDNLSGINSINWHGDIWDEGMVYWDDQSLTFSFTVTYTNGTVKSINKMVYIVDDEYWRQHMKF